MADKAGTATNGIVPADNADRDWSSRTMTAALTTTDPPPSLPGS